jgi:hypothetical protein
VELSQGGSSSFLKKEAKNFCSRVSAQAVPIMRGCQGAKVFWFFFLKKNSLWRSEMVKVASLSYPSGSTASGRL